MLGWEAVWHRGACQGRALRPAADAVPGGGLHAQVQQRLLSARNQVLGRTLAARADLLAAAGRHREAAAAARGAAAIVAAAFGERAVQTALARHARPSQPVHVGVAWACCCVRCSQQSR